MNRTSAANRAAHISLRPVDRDNWRRVVDLHVTPAQQAFVAEVSRYLVLCHYGGDWRPLAIYQGEEVIGFLMWAIDPSDESCWLGGILIDCDQQGRGYGRAAIQAAITLLAREQGRRHFALSYKPANVVAQHLYRSLGFIETDEWDDDEVVARLHLVDG